jgi:hypothetical protein
MRRKLGACAFALLASLRTKWCVAFEGAAAHHLDGEYFLSTCIWQACG